MGKIVISQNVSLDGAVQDPTGEEGFRHGGWLMQTGQTTREAWASLELDEALHAEALLLGRRSDQWFASRWSTRTGAWADRLNSLPKYVVSSTLEDAAWSNSTVLKGEVVQAVSQLKRELNGEIVVYASHQLVHLLMEHDLVDELRLTVYPVVLGDGQRLFGATGDKRPLRLVESRIVGELTYLVYERLRQSSRGLTDSREVIGVSGSRRQRHTAPQLPPAAH